MHIYLRACVQDAHRPLFHSPMKEPPIPALDQRQLPLLFDSNSGSKATLSRHSPTGARSLPARPAMLALCRLITLTYLSYTHAALSRPGSLGDVDGDKEIPSLGVPRTVQQSWVMYSPYYAAEPYVPPPRGCSVDQVRRASFCVFFALYRVAAIPLEPFPFIESFAPPSYDSTERH